jgi:hypothetical protein
MPYGTGPALLADSIGSVDRLPIWRCCSCKRRTHRPTRAQQSVRQRRTRWCAALLRPTDLQHASCDLQHATSVYRTMQHAACTMQPMPGSRAPCAHSGAQRRRAGAHARGRTAHALGRGRGVAAVQYHVATLHATLRHRSSVIAACTQHATRRSLVARPGSAGAAARAMRSDRPALTLVCPLVLPPAM